MKKSLLYLFMLVCSVSIFMSCSDDDDEVKYPIDTELAGGYVGNLSVNVDGNQMGTTENQKITISQSNKGTNQIALSLKNFTFLVNVGDIEVDPCTVKAIDSGYAFEGQQNLDLVQPLGNCPVSISGTVKGSNINIEIGVKVGAPLNQNVKATFVGRKLTGSESSEAKITSFIIDDEAVVEQPVINEEAGTIVFAVNEEVESLKFTPIIEISEGATITPASGVAQDFSNNKKVTYTVTAEDGTVKVYTAFVEGTRKVLKYSFEDWKEGSKNDELLPKDLWAGSAAGAGILGGTLLRKETREDGTYAAKLITFEYPNEPNSLVPKITAGSIFIGKFDMMPALQGDRLSCTKFGLDAETVSLGGKPLCFKGVYKYESGSNYLDASNYEDVKPVDIKDKGQIQAVLYKVQTGEDGKEIVLTGHDVNTSELRVAVANIIVEDIKEYTPFNIEFEYLQEYDQNAKYKFAIVCSSSKDGDLFKGAGGSTLIVDEFEVICE